MPRLLKEFLAAPEIYFDSISLVRMNSFVRGRVALLGDAGYGATIGGMGTGMAVVGANAGPFLAPATAHGLWLRNVSHHLLTRAASAITLPDYPN